MSTTEPSGRAVVVGVIGPPRVPPPRRQRREPVAGPFDHDPGCKTPDADPQFHEIETDYWQRVCSCGTEYARTTSGGIDPNSEAARPSWRAHRHDHGCEHRELAAVVKVEQHPDGGWRSSCVSCATIQLYWHDPEHWVPQPDGSMVRRTSYGSVLFGYPLASDDG
jgi:hypothetical protein